MTHVVPSCSASECASSARAATAAGRRQLQSAPSALVAVHGLTRRALGRVAFAGQQCSLRCSVDWRPTQLLPARASLRAQNGFFRAVHIKGSRVRPRCLFFSTDVWRALGSPEGRREVAVGCLPGRGCKDRIARILPRASAHVRSRELPFLAPTQNAGLRASQRGQLARGS